MQLPEIAAQHIAYWTWGLTVGRRKEKKKLWLPASIEWKAKFYTRLLVHGCCHAAAVETDVKNPEETVSIGEAYRQLWEVVKLPAVRRFAVVLVTFR